MYFTADLHTHSRYAKACSPQLSLETMYQWAQLKGINIISTGDFTHPGWLKELQEKLVPDGSGFYILKDPPRLPAFPGAYPANIPVKFCLSTEISCVYSSGGKSRQIHNLIYATDFKTAAQINTFLSKFTDLSLDGRPTINESSRNLLELILTASENAYLVPAHAWTPWFSLFGSVGGYDSLQDCFKDLTPKIFALETGLSSDPSMNWQCSFLDKLTMLSSSDAHRLHNLGRELNRFDTDMSYDAMFEAIKTGKGFKGTFEAFPEKGKYSHDGHRQCKICWSPAETRMHQGICPACGKIVTVGAFNRVEQLADRTKPSQPAGAADFEYMIPLPEILSELSGVASTAKKVNTAFIKAINFAGNEFNLLYGIPLEDVQAWQPRLGEAIRRMRAQQVHRTPGYDGVYGSIRLFNNISNRPGKNQQGSLF